VDQHPIGLRVVVADDAVDELVRERIGARRHAGQAAFVARAPRSVSANWPRRKNASRGVVAIQFGLPRPALRNLWVAALVAD
jgi:hypothetical protein